MLPVQLYSAIRLLEEERQNVIFRQNIERKVLRDASDPFSVNETLFIATYRLTKDMVRFLHNRLSPYMANSLHPNAVSPLLRLLTALIFFATGGYQRRIGQQYMISVCQRSVSSYVKEISELIVGHLADEYIKFPTMQNEKQRIKLKFMQQSRFPGTIGAIDCTHVAILSPTEEEHNYLNRKGYHSKNIQIICDYDLKILNINATYAGATHDSYIWRRSIIRRELQMCFNNGDHTSWLIGDSGYPQEPWLMTPVLNVAPGSPEEQYNRRNASARNCIERCNGVLKTRFRCLLGERVLRYSPEKVGNIVIACAVLHNICRSANLEIDDLVQVDKHVANQERNVCEDVPEGRNIRAQLIRQYF